VVLVSIFIVPIRISRTGSPNVKIPKLSLDNINKAAKESIRAVEKFLKTGTDLIDRGLVILT
jgi:hypothetical protein